MDSKPVKVYINSSLKLNAQINHGVKTSFFHLRNLAKMKSCLTYKSLEIAIHALVSSKFDYCNLLYKGISQSSTAAKGPKCGSQTIIEY